MSQQHDEPAILIPVDDVLERLDHGNNWLQGGWEDDGGRMCLHRGIRVCQPIPGDAYLIEQVARIQGWGTGFNDAEGTTFDDVKQRLVEHREVFPHELEETFGPQWEAIVALVRRAAVLTPAEARNLAAAWDAAWDAASAAARNAASAAAWDAARNAASAAAGVAAWDAASNAGWVAAWDAASGAAWALVVRDLIGQHGFEQHHYDALVGPWATVIGPAHPDDTP